MKTKLHLGCGHIIKEGWLNHDRIQLPGVDVVHDLRAFPWPFEDGQFDEIYADNVLEHLPNTMATMEEIYRVTKAGAKIFLGVPYWNSYEGWGDPTHERLFSEEKFEFFDPSTSLGQQRSYYSQAKFKIDKIVFCINPFKPLFRSPSFYRFNGRVEHPFAKAILRAVAAYFCNIIHGLEVHLPRL